jgi:hypothetical protein
MQRRKSRSICTLEIVRVDSASEQPVCVVLSLAGRDSTLLRSWGRPDQLLNHEELEDLVTWLGNVTTQALLVAGGVQGTLLG